MSLDQHGQAVTAETGDWQIRRNVPGGPCRAAGQSAVRSGLETGERSASPWVESHALRPITRKALLTSANAVKRASRTLLPVSLNPGRARSGSSAATTARQRTRAAAQSAADSSVMLSAASIL